METSTMGNPKRKNPHKNTINFHGVIPIKEYTEKDFLAIKQIIKDNKHRKQKKRTNILKEKEPVKVGELEVSRFRLAVAIAKSIFSRGTDRTIIQNIARSWFIQLEVLLKEKDNGIYIDKDTVNRLRDFSKSCRDGELAQGISYIFAQDWLGAIAVEDFNTYCYHHKSFAPRCDGRTPDYVLINGNGSITLLETKGTMEINPIRDMINGMKQCENGNDYLIKHNILPKDYYVSAITFEDVNEAKEKTTISVVDPSTEDNRVLEKSPEGKAESVIREYSKFFYLAGDSRLDEMLSSGDKNPNDNLEPYYRYFADLCKHYEAEKNNYEDRSRMHSFIHIAGYKTNSIMSYAREKIRIDLKLGLIAISSMKNAEYFDAKTAKRYRVELGITYEAAKKLSESFENNYFKKTEHKKIDGRESELEIFPDGTYMMVSCVDWKIQLRSRSPYV